MLEGRRWRDGNREGQWVSEGERGRDEQKVEGKERPDGEKRYVMAGGNMREG